jgi:hypothetical protein
LLSSLAVSMGAAACSTTSADAPQPALMAGNPSAQCLSALEQASEKLSGQKMLFPPDAFTRSEVIALNTASAAASGRMAATNYALLLQTTPQGCQLALRSSGKAVPVTACSCKPR